MPKHSTLTEAVRATAAEHPDRPAFVYLHEAGRTMYPEQLTYRELDCRARGVAARLRLEGGDPDRPVLLLYPPTLEFVTAFLGCFYAGRTAVPAPLPDGSGERPARVAGILRDASAGAVLTQHVHREAVTTWLSGTGAGDVACAATDGPATDIADPADPPGPDTGRPTAQGPDDLAFLQYTSGSTGRPKGIMITHGNLVANQEAIRRCVRSWRGVKAGTWLPPYHDMGLTGMTLHPLWMAGTSVMMSPISFIKQPHRWLRMIHDHGIEGTASPDFGYELCVRRVTEEESAGLDLSSLKVALNGAEPVRSGTLRSFAERFAANGLRPQALHPCYGLAEATLFVSGGERDLPPVEFTADARDLERDELVPARDGRASRTLVSSGLPRDIELLIVDPVTRKVLDDGRVGEIWLRGPSVAAGYWRRPELTEEVFSGVTGEGSPGWLRTGDLGAVRQGELFVTGRIEEMLVHHGCNLYPHDIEQAVQDADPAFRGGFGAVFSVSDKAGRVRVVAVQELRPQACAEGDLPALATAVQSVLSRDFRLPSASVLLVRPGTVRRTTSGKTQRTFMQRMFLDGALPCVHARLEPQTAGLLPEEARNGAEPSPAAATAGR